ncbi:MAG: hypothetical protein PHQ96_02930 [Candidatus Omnitrophica bacterium]|nr:hypothetical protein [Candidatus Omnitrophota bacterium]
MMKVSKSMSLVEVMVAGGILAFCLVGILGVYASLFILADVARHKTLASNAAQYEMEQLKKEDFDNLDNYNNDVFYLAFTSSAHTSTTITTTRPEASLIIAAGRIEIRDITTYTKSNMKEIRVVASFKSRNRVIGEDTNLDGILNGAEDINGNARLDSSVELVTLVTK